MWIFKKKCKHKLELYQESNALQLDYMGYPLRLFLMKCSKCGAHKQQWLDVPLGELDEVKDGKSFVLVWK